jgi:hypothetical protein
VRLAGLRGAATAVALVAACAHHGEGRSQTVGLGSTEQVFVDVINDNYYDARIYAIYGGGARRALGTVPGNERRLALAIPWQPRALLFEVVLVVDGSVYRSEGMNVAPGDVVQLRLPPNIATSGFFTRVSP